MDVEKFEQLLMKVYPKLTKKCTYMRKAISLEQKLVVTLRYVEIFIDIVAMLNHFIYKLFFLLVYKNKSHSSTKTAKIPKSVLDKKHNKNKYHSKV